MLPRNIIVPGDQVDNGIVWVPQCLGGAGADIFSINVFELSPLPLKASWLFGPRSVIRGTRLGWPGLRVYIYRPVLSGKMPAILAARSKTQEVSLSSDATYADAAVIVVFQPAVQPVPETFTTT